MPAIDCLATEIHFADHLAPIYRALPEPGDFIIHSSIFEKKPIRPERLPPWTTETIFPERPVLVASYGDVKKARKQGRTRIAFIEHGIGQSYGTGHGSYAGGKDRDEVSLFLTPNEYSARLWREAYPNATVEVVGSPKLDALPQRDRSPGPVVAISFHWQCYLVPETTSAISHYRWVLPDLAKRFTIIGHGHPRAMERLTRYYRRSGIEPVDDFAEVCRRADLYVCDNSSSLYEFAATGRPVVVMNAPQYRRDVSHGLRFWEAANVGIQVNEPEELADAIELALTDPPYLREQREHALSLVYTHRTGATQRAVEALTAWSTS